MKSAWSLIPRPLVNLTGCSWIAWKQASAKDDALAYEEFLQQFPNSARVAHARSRLEELSFQTAKASDKIEDLRAFTEKYPASAHTPAAISRLKEKEVADFAAATNPKGLRAFIKVFPNSEKREEAEHRLAKIEAAQDRERKAKGAVKSKTSTHEKARQVKKNMRFADVVRLIGPPDKDAGMGLDLGPPPMPLPTFRWFLVREPPLVGYLEIMFYPQGSQIDDFTVTEYSTGVEAASAESAAQATQGQESAASHQTQPAVPSEMVAVSSNDAQSLRAKILADHPMGKCCELAPLRTDAAKRDLRLLRIALYRLDGYPISTDNIDGVIMAFVAERARTDERFAPVAQTFIEDMSMPYERTGFTLKLDGTPNAVASACELLATTEYATSGDFRTTGHGFTADGVPYRIHFFWRA